jgi:hypothetical protein
MQIHTVEAFVHGMLKKSGGTVSRIYQTWGIGIFALPVLVAIALAGLVLSRPGASNWMPEAVRTEFATPNLSPDVAPKQLAQPATAVRTVRAN